MNLKSAILKSYTTFQILSIDVVLGSLAVGYMAVRLLDVTPVKVWWLILAISVWIIYSADHLLDGLKNKYSAVISRHRYYYKNRKPLLLAIIILSIINIYLSIIYMDISIIYAGIIMCFVVFIYLMLINYGNYAIVQIIPKELVIAIIYVSGIYLAPVYWHGATPDNFNIIVFIILAVLVWAEGVMASYFDYDKDVSDHYNSFAISNSKTTTRNVLIALHLTIEILLLILLFFFNTSLELAVILVLIVINFSLGIMILYPNNCLFMKYYRAIGESVFMLPALLILV